MNTTPPTSPARAVAPPAAGGPTSRARRARPAAEGSLHDALDDALVAIRRVLQRPGYRARLLEGLPGRIEMGMLRLLRIVQRSEGAPSIGEVAEELTIDPSTASRVVDRAVDAGLLERHACTDDRRRARLRLTPTGIELLDQVTARRRALLAEVTADWDDHDLDQLIGRLGALIAGFDRLEGNA